MRDYKLYLLDIKEAVEKIEVFTKGLTYEAFAYDGRVGIYRLKGFI